MAKRFFHLPLLVSLKWLTIYPLGLNKRAPMTPKIMAADIPALVTSNIPVMTPIKPCSSASAIAPCTNEFPKLVIGTVAPAPAKSMSGSYRPNPSKTAPATTSVVRVCAVVNINTSNIMCPMTQIRPLTTKAQKKAIGYQLLLQEKRHTQCRGSNYSAEWLKESEAPQWQQLEFDSTFFVQSNLISIHT